MPGGKSEQRLALTCICYGCSLRNGSGRSRGLPSRQKRRWFLSSFVLNITGHKIGLGLVVQGHGSFEIALPDRSYISGRRVSDATFAGAFHPNFRAGNLATPYGNVLFEMQVLGLNG